MTGKTWAVIAVVAVIVIGITIGVFAINNNSKTDKQNVANANVITNTVTNTIVNEINVNVIANTIVEKNTNTTAENVTKNETTTTETFTETPKTMQEKAILIAKNNYGEGKNIEFSVVQIDDGKGRVVVLVTDANTTQALAYYHVDVENNTFEIQY